MTMCSWITRFASTLGILAWIVLVVGTFYGVTYVPDFPQSVDGKNFVHTPQSNAKLNAFVLGVVCAAVASIFSFAAVLKGPKTIFCMVALLPGPVLVLLPVIVLNASELLRHVRAL